MSNITKQSGVTLIESMIALLVISVGLLGIAGLQIHALKQNSSAYWHTQAVLAAYNMADRIRANKIAIASYDGADTSSAADQDCISTACSTEEIRNADVADWKALIAVLPSGKGIVRSPDDDQLDIVVMWDDEGTGATGEDCGTDHSASGDLSCYTITMSTLALL